MTIEQLEQQIKDHGSLLASALLQYELGGYCFGDLAAVDSYRARMDALIAERDAKQATQ